MALPIESFPLDRTEARSLLFSEQEAFWTLPLHETSIVSDVGVTLGKGYLQDYILFRKNIVRLVKKRKKKKEKKFLYFEITVFFSPPYSYRYLLILCVWTIRC